MRRCLPKLCLNMCGFLKLVEEWAPGCGCPLAEERQEHRPGTEALDATQVAGGLRDLSVLAPQRKTPAPVSLL